MMRDHAKGLAGALTIAVGCWSCSLPWTVWRVPRVRGVIRAGEAPVAGALVKWLEPSGPESWREVGVGRTDATGSFEIPAVGGHWIWESAFELRDSWMTWRLTVEAEGISATLWQQERLHIPHARSTPGWVELDCDVRAAPPCRLLGSDWKRWEVGGSLPTEGGRRTTG